MKANETIKRGSWDYFIRSNDRPEIHFEIPKGTSPRAQAQEAQIGASTKAAKYGVEEYRTFRTRSVGRNMGGDLQELVAGEWRTIPETLNFEDYCDRYPFRSGPELSAGYENYLEAMSYAFEAGLDVDELAQIRIEIPLECGHMKRDVTSTTPIDRLWIRCPECGATSTPEGRWKAAQDRGPRKRARDLEPLDNVLVDQRYLPVWGAVEVLEGSRGPRAFVIVRDPAGDRAVSFPADEFVRILATDVPDPDDLPF